MAECSFHPGVETEVSCPECGRYICPKDMVSTPVGYKCKVCAKPAKGQYTYVKPRQLAAAAIAAGLVGTGGALLIGVIGWNSLILDAVWGFAVAESARRASGGHRGNVLAGVAVGGIVAGGLIGSIGLLGIAIAAIAAAATLSWTWGR